MTTATYNTKIKELDRGPIRSVPNIKIVIGLLEYSYDVHFFYFF